MFLDIKKEAAASGNIDLKVVANFMINSPPGKWGHNHDKQRRTKILKDHNVSFWQCLYCRSTSAIFCNC